MKTNTTDRIKVRIFFALLFALVLAGCYDGGGGWGGSPGYYSDGGYGYGGNTYYSNNVYRGYGGYSNPGLFCGYPPAHEAWDASTRGRQSYGYGGGHEDGGSYHGGGGQPQGGGEHQGGGGGHSGGGGEGGHGSGGGGGSHGGSGGGGSGHEH